MNTADRSIALVDAALRRRFRFISFPPNYTALIDYYDDFEDLEDVRETAQTDSNPYRSLVALSILALRELNDQIVDTPDLGKGKQIGHSYLMGPENVSEVLDAWRYEILPLLEEYYFGQFDRIREELFRGSGDRLFHWEMEEIADFTADDLRRTLANLGGIPLAEPETETEEDTQNTLNLTYYWGRNYLNLWVVCYLHPSVYLWIKMQDDNNREFNIAGSIAFTIIYFALVVMVVLV
ncbi:hypothetical protein [Halostagnicola sp. A56]|uniref:hypothetical protein n=1 Tax=Halostagnicola sp. A56 TaxID=1495067 RepID=UPI00067987D2|nr:hypothetical protein [Halostagnicola sp. A56]